MIILLVFLVSRRLRQVSCRRHLHQDFFVKSLPCHGPTKQEQLVKGQTKRKIAEEKIEINEWKRKGKSKGTKERNGRGEQLAKRKRKNKEKRGEQKKKWMEKEGKGSEEEAEGK